MKIKLLLVLLACVVYCQTGILVQSTQLLFNHVLQKCASSPTECIDKAMKASKMLFCSVIDQENCTEMQKNYEAIIDINSLASIISDGWHIHINPESKYKNVFDLTKALDKEYKTFALTGPFGAGKTFITNLLAGTGLMSGETVHTLGISIYLKQLIAFIDTAGSGNPVKMDADAILDRRLTDFYIEEVVKDTAQGHIHVVNRMTNLIEEKLMSLMRQTDEYILIIHNLRNVKTLQEAKEALKRDIEEVFPEAKIEPDELTGCVFYKSRNAVHFIYAEEATEAGNFYNKKTTEKILSYISNMNMKKLEQPNFYPRLMNALQKNVETFLFNKTLEDNMVVQQKQQSKSSNYLSKTIWSFLGYGDNVKTSHEQQFSKLIIEGTVYNETNSTQMLRPARIILPDSEGLVISKRITSRNGILTIDYNDKFVPAIYALPNIFRSTFIVSLDVLDAIQNTKVSVYPDHVGITGERICLLQSHGYTQSDFIINTKKCGKFYIQVRPPIGWYLERKKVDFANGEHATCTHGICQIDLPMYTNDDL